MKIIKLLCGAILFIVLCGSGMMLLILFLGFSEGHVNTRSLVSLLIAVSAFLASFVSLYYLSRETPTIEPSEVSRKFKVRKLKLQLLVIALITALIVAVPFTAGIAHYIRLEAAIIFVLFFGFYILLAKKLWSCPACENQLPFMSKYTYRQSIKACPNCHTQLQ